MNRTIFTEWLDFQGMNVKGNPRMPVTSVRNDVEQFSKNCDSGVMCEFRWGSYWGVAQRVLANEKVKPVERWGSFPGYQRGRQAPVSAGQPVFWKRSIFEKEKGKRTLCHMGRAGISEFRLIRGVLLAHKRTMLKVWNVVAHFVVGGDQDSDGPKRKKILRANIRRFVRFLTRLKKSGHPIIGQLDANIRKGGWAYTLWKGEMRKVGAQFHGDDDGVEYLFGIDEHSKTKIEVKRTINLYPKSRGGVLFTDHESRGMHYRLWQRVKVS